MKNEIKGDGSKVAWGIDTTPNPMREMLMELFLNNLITRIEDSPSSAIKYLKDVVKRLEKKDEK